MEWAKKLSKACDVLNLNEILNAEEQVLAKLRERLFGHVNSQYDKEENKSRCEYLQSVAISSLHLFVMENWTGPPLKQEQIAENIRQLCSKEFNDLVIADLRSNDEGIHNLVRIPGFFWISYVILIEVFGKLKNEVSSTIWSLRCLTAYQGFLEEKSPFVYDKFLSLLEHYKNTVADMDRETKVQLHIECSHLYLQYYEYQKAKEHLEIAREILGIEIALTGSPGKRTKFQEKELAQLRLEVKISEERDERNISNSELRKDLPKDVLLEDDTLLPKVKYSNNESLPLLKPLEQAYILSQCNFLQKTLPKDNLLAEELHPYVQAVLCDPQTWAVQSKALYIRSMLESKNSRTVERSMMQMEGLVEEYRKVDPIAESRTYLLQSVDVPPRWTYEASFARILVSLGCTKAALEIFERIESWDDVITCYHQLGRHEKAENIIRDQLQKNETAKLWCLLGDVTLNIEFYEKAWEFSNHRNARSQRSIGFRLLRTGKLADCIPYFQKSLEISPLQPPVWFSLGCAAMATGHFDLAQTAFQRYVTLDPDSHEAWNNLSNVFIRTKQKHKAYKALKEALKASHSSWQIWENFLLVTVDIGEFKDTIRAFHNLLELKRKEMDTEVLRLLVGAVKSDISDASGVPASALMPKMKELFGRISSQITNNAEIWLLYGDLYCNTEELEDKEKVLNNYTKALRCCSHSAAWEKGVSKIKLVVEICLKLIEATFNIINLESIEGRDVQIISSSKMAVSNFLKRFDILVDFRSSFIVDLPHPPNSVQNTMAMSWQQHRLWRQQIVYPDGLSTGVDEETSGHFKKLKDDFNKICELLT